MIMRLRVHHPAARKDYLKPDDLAINRDISPLRRFKSRRLATPPSSPSH
jgi:hypothetical protein